MEKVLLFVLFLIVSIALWLFATATFESGKNTKASFIVRSVFYFIAVFAAFIVGYLIAL